MRPWPDRPRLMFSLHLVQTVIFYNRPFASATQSKKYGVYFYSSPEFLKGNFYKKTDRNNILVNVFWR